MKKIAISMALCLVAGAAAAQSRLFVYPKGGQTPEQQAADERECSSWAMQQTGFDPMYVPSTGPAPQREGGGVVGGALLGAAIGGIADGGDGAGKGAAIGGLLGGMRQSSHNRSAQDSYERQRQAAEQQQMQRANEYRRAYSGCLNARNYSVS